jgi:hypothetical protein
MTLDKEFLFEASLLLNLDHDFFFRSPFQAQQAAQQKKRCMDRLKWNELCSRSMIKHGNETWEREEGEIKQRSMNKFNWFMDGEEGEGQGGKLIGWRLIWGGLLDLTSELVDWLSVLGIAWVLGRLLESWGDCLSLVEIAWVFWGFHESCGNLEKLEHFLRLSNLAINPNFHPISDLKPNKSTSLPAHNSISIMFSFDYIFRCLWPSRWREREKKQQIQLIRSLP